MGYMGGPKTVVPGVVISHNQDDYLIDSGSITPVPEPSSVILFASGLLVLGLITCVSSAGGINSFQPSAVSFERPTCSFQELDSG